MFKKTTLLRALIAAAICTSSFATSASAFTINFDNIAAGANANTDQVAVANGVSFASGHLVDTLDANFNIIGTHWAAYSMAVDNIAPDIFVGNPGTSGWGAAPSGTNAIDARWDQVLVQFANPTQLGSFSFNLDSSSYGNLQAQQVLFLDNYGNTLFTSPDYFQSATSFTQTFTSGLTVSAVLLTAGKFYDNLTIANVAPVPEPETYAMMLAGLGLLGFVGSRRKKM
jgi:hypothetical protein